MLSRRADSLFWMGRYLERTENVSRFLRIEYFSTADSPVNDDVDVALKTVAGFCGKEIGEEEKINEADFLIDLTLNLENDTSIFYSICKCRDNAKGCRDLISKECWESINAIYLFAKDFGEEKLATIGLYEFTKTIQSMSSSVKTSADGTLIHDEVWEFIRLGIHYERAIQITRVILSKIKSIDTMLFGKEDIPLENHQWIATLRLFEALDMNRKVYKRTPSNRTTLDFLLLHPEFPRSILYNVDRVTYFLRRIENNFSQSLAKDTLLYKSEKLASLLKFNEFENIEKDITKFVQNIHTNLLEINHLIAEKYVF